MSVHRSEKKKDYTIISNCYLRDQNLSLKAKGLLTVMLSLPDSWEFSVRGLTSICSESAGTVNRTLQELEKFGYLVRRQTRLKNGHTGGTVYDIYENARKHDTGSASAGKTANNIPHKRNTAEEDDAGSQPCVQNEYMVSPRTENEHTETPCIQNPRTEDPHTDEPCIRKPCAEKPYTEKPCAENEAQINTKELSTKELSTKELNTKQLNK
jgi:predicted transcriptional regulator